MRAERLARLIRPGENKPHMDLSQIVVERVRMSVGNKMSYSEGLTEKSAWEIYLKDNYQLQHKVTKPLERNGFLDPFISIDPKDEIFRDVGFKTYDVEYEKDRFLDMTEFFVNIKQMVSKAPEKYLDHKYENKPEQIILHIENTQNMFEKTLKYAFLVQVMAKGANLRSGMAFSDKHVISWIEACGERRILNFQSISELINMVISGKTFKKPGFEKILPKFTFDAAPASVIFGSWQYMMAERSAGNANLANAEQYALKTLEIDRDDTFGAMYFLENIGNTMLSLTEFGGGDEAVIRISNGTLANNSMQELEELASVHRSVKMALSASAVRLNLLEWRDE